MQLLELIAILCILTCIWGQPCDVVRWTGCKGPKPKPNTNTANVLHSKLKGLGMMPSQVRDHAQDYDDEEEEDEDAERKTNQKKILRIFNDIISSRLSKELKERSDDLEDLDVAAKRQEEDEKKNEAHEGDNLFNNVDYDNAVLEENTGTKETNSIQNDDSAISIDFNEVEQILKSLEITLLRKRNVLEEERKSLLEKENEEKQSYDDVMNIINTPMGNLKRLRDDLIQLQELLTRKPKRNTK
ncbi:uncharacterized protein [Clytia hemisphaerica]